MVTFHSGQEYYQEYSSRPILFILYINDLQGVVGSICKLFVDDCKLYRNISSEADQKDLQEDIGRLCEWSKDWLHVLSTEDSESDLGILSKKNLKFDEQSELNHEFD